VSPAFSAYEFVPHAILRFIFNADSLVLALNMPEVADKAVQVCIEDIVDALFPLESDRTHTTSSDALQQRFERVRDMKLRQWFHEAHSTDPQTQIAAQARLHLQFLLRNKRGEIITIKAARDAAKAKGGTLTSTEAIRKKLKTAQIESAFLMRTVRGDQTSSEKKINTMAKKWAKAKHTLDHVLGDIELDKRGDFGVYKYDEIGDDILGSREEVGEMVGNDVSDDDEEGGVLLPVEMRMTFNV
jgi:hypothetical protein